jgi:hypothetical protein
MRVSNAVLLCTMVFLGFPLSSAIRAEGGSVLPIGWHRSKVGESNHPSVKLASSTHTVTSVATNVSPGGATCTGSHEQGMKYIAASIAFSSIVFSSVAILICR